MNITEAYAITAEDVDRERHRVSGDLSKIELKNVIKLRERALPELGPRDVKLKILAVSGEHNVLHAALADVIDIAMKQGGVMFPGNSAVGEVVAVGGDVVRFKAGDIVGTHCNAQPDAYGYPLRIWGFDAQGSTGFFAKEVVLARRQLEFPA